MYVCKTLFKHASLDTYLQLLLTADFHEGRHTDKIYKVLINYKKSNLTLTLTPP